MRKKIFIIIPLMSVGGAQKFVISLANALSPDLYKITVISLSGKNGLESELNEGIDFRVAAKKHSLDIGFFLNLNKMIKAAKPDIIFSISPYSYFVANIVSLFRGKASNIISHHITIPPNAKQDRLQKLFFSFVTKEDIIATVSKNQEVYTADRYKLDRKLFTTIHNGIDITRWKLAPADFSKASIREKYGLGLEDKVIVMTANLRPDKNHKAAIKALRILHEFYNLNSYLMIVGGGVMLQELQGLVSELNLIKYVKFVGSQDDVRPFYWMSDLFTLASDKVETFSIAALEAMACGLPSVLTDIGGASEMVEVNMNGFLCLPTEDELSSKWFKALNFNFDARKISADIHFRFNQVDMVKKYELMFNQG